MFTNTRLAGAILICFCLPCLSCPADTHSLPAAEDIERLAKESENIGADFFRSGWAVCLAHEYKGPFTAAPASDKLKKLAKKASHNQQQITEQQMRLKTIIEQYQADDWDKRYGATGLWRRLAGQITYSKLKKCLYDYYFALANDEPEKTELMRACLVRLDSLETTDSSSLHILLKAKVLTALSYSDSTYKKMARDFFDRIEMQKDFPCQISGYLHIEKLRFSSPPDVEHWDRAVEDMISQNCCEDSGLVLSMCFLRRQFDPDAFKKTLVSRPNVKNNLETALLENYSAAGREGLLDEELLARTTPFEAELLAEAAQRDGPEQYLHLLKKISQSKGNQTPAVLYVTAKAYIGSDPAEAVRLMLKANKLYAEYPDRNGNFNHKVIAQQAAELAYQLLTTEPNICSLAEEAFDGYSKTAGRDIEPNLQYLHTVVLQKCGDPDGRMKLLRKISADAANPFADRARFELAIESIRKKSIQKNKERAQLAKELAAVCYTLKDCEYVAEIMELLSQIIDPLDIYLENEQDIDALLNACGQLSRYCLDCLDVIERRRAGLFLAEFIILKGQPDVSEPNEVEKLLAEMSTPTGRQDIDFLRCLARLYAAQQKFKEAAEIWGKIAVAKKPKTTQPVSENWKWWRAKYYQLYCLSKRADADTKESSHTIDVLLNSYDNIPAPWDKKLQKLMENCQKNNYSLP